VLHPVIRGAARAYGSGAFGGFLTGVLMSLFGLIKLPYLYGVYLIPSLTGHHLSLCALWGGLFGMAFAFSFLDRQPIARGFFYGCILAVVMLLAILPLVYHAGWFGQHYGHNTWAFITLYSWCWGIFSSLWHRLSS